MRKALFAVAALAFAPALLMAGPNPGDPAPDFTLYDTAYSTHTLSDLRGSVVQLFFWYSG